MPYHKKYEMNDFERAGSYTMFGLVCIVCSPVVIVCVVTVAPVYLGLKLWKYIKRKEG